jgi:hypothetical protein
LTRVLASYPASYRIRHFNAGTTWPQGSQKTFDYSGLPAEEAQELRKIGTRVSKLARVTMPLGIELGNQLARGKKILGFGNFGGWCDTLSLSCRMADLSLSIAHFAAEHGRDAVEGLSVCGILTERIRGLQNDVQ